MNRAPPAVVLDHPLVRHHLARLRDASTPPAEFRGAVRALSMLLAYEALRDLPMRRTSVRTPLESTAAARVRGRIGLVPILRAGLGMVDPVLGLLPEAEVWHLGVYRDETTLQPVAYYNKFPARRPVDVALVLDPMLATGGSAIAALRAVRDWGVKRVKLLAVIAAPEGLRAVRSAYPDAAVFVCARDRRLNDRGYILPGLGDAGDRQFGTVPPPRTAR
ncbi:MAG: uracil phosphoribosyltransferase [Verrucomicrobia bacterium]|nr:uracil phosphoribosyltransferase [Verrucomicrobiota bacterium]